MSPTLTARRPTTRRISRLPVDVDLTFIDLFSGAGGTSTGLTQAGFRLLLAANHEEVCTLSHAANHPGAEHLRADINQYDMRRLPRARVLAASPICTEISPAGARKRIPKGQRPEGFDGLEIDDTQFSRTRATAWDVVRATEVWLFDAVIVENVPEFVTQWHLFDAWLLAMHSLGYTSQIVSVSAAHVYGPGYLPVPQWRDRVFIVFTRNGLTPPDLELRPRAHCGTCAADVDAVQTWKPGRSVGKYRRQYVYTCPTCTTIIEPYIRPVASIMDWDDLGDRIADRARPLAAGTIRRIEHGLKQFPAQPTIITTNHGGHDGRPAPADRSALGARTVKVGDALLVPPPVRKLGSTELPDMAATFASTPLPGLPARRERPEPPLAGPYAPFVVEYRKGAFTSPITGPITTVVAAGNHHALVTPWRRPGAPVPTFDAPVPVEDCHFRIIRVREQKLAQGFPEEYVIYGTRHQQTMQIGNAVPTNVARWIGERLREVLS